MNATDNTPETLLEAVKYFADYQHAHDFMVQIGWPSGQVCCPQCGSARVRYIQTRRQWECREQHPKRRFSLKTGTIMEDSPLPMEKWLAALWLEVNAKNSVSSWEAHRSLGVTQKTAWFMLHRIRRAIKSGSFDKMGGPNKAAESDESYIGGLYRNMHRNKRPLVIGTGGMNKTPVMGLLERHAEKGKSKVRAFVVPNVRGETLRPIIYKHLQPGTMLYTDAASGYRALSAEYFHQFVDHAEEYVRGAVHTNGLENFWSLFKRCIKGTHVSVYPAHLEAYLDSEAFRFNNRKLTDGQRFVEGSKGFFGKRLTYDALIGRSALEGGTAVAS